MAGKQSGEPQRQADVALLARITQGDELALEEFYNKFFPQLYRYIYYRVGRDHQHTEEVVNDTFVEALAKIPLYDAARGKVEAWLITLSRNKIRASNNKHGKARELEQSWSMLEGELDTIFANLTAGKAPPDEISQLELGELVGKVLGLLPADYHQALEDKYIKGLSVRQMAAASGKTEKSVESQLTRARQAFREAYKTFQAAD